VPYCGGPPHLTSPITTLLNTDLCAWEHSPKYFSPMELLGRSRASPQASRVGRPAARLRPDSQRQALRRREQRVVAAKLEAERIINVSEQLRGSNVWSSSGRCQARGRARAAPGRDRRHGEQAARGARPAVRKGPGAKGQPRSAAEPIVTGALRTRVARRYAKLKAERMQLQEINVRADVVKENKMRAELDQQENKLRAELDQQCERDLDLARRGSHAARQSRSSPVRYTAAPAPRHKCSAQNLTSNCPLPRLRKRLRRPQRGHHQPRQGR
jgi:hypothetical protein